MRVSAVRLGRSSTVAVTLVVAAFATLTLAVAAPVDAAVSVITSVAGGGPPATAKATALAVTPLGIAVSGWTLYVSDELTCSVRAVDARTGAQRLVVGTGLCPDHPLFSEIVPCEPSTCVPGILAVGPNGDLYGINGERVVRIDSNHVGHAVAGNGQRGFSGDGGPATEATLASPNALAFDAAGNLYISDSNNQRVRKVSPAGIIATVAGNGTEGYIGTEGPATSAQLKYPSALTADNAGNLYIGTESAVLRVSPDGVIHAFAGPSSTVINSSDEGPALTAKILKATGLAVDAAGNVIISDDVNVRRVDTTGYIRPLAGRRSTFRTDGGDGGPAVDAGLHHPGPLALGPTGQLYIAELEGSRVRQVDSAAIITTVAGNGHVWSGTGGPAADAQLGDARLVEFDSAGNLIVGAGGLFKIDPSGTMTLFAGNPDPAVDVYDPANLGDGGPATKAVVQAIELAADGHGNVFLNEMHRIRRIDTAGIITTVAGDGTDGTEGDGGPALQAKIRSCCWLAADAAGNVYFNDNATRIRRVGTDGLITTVVGGGEQGFAGDDGPASPALVDAVGDIELDKAGNLYFVDKGRIRKIDTAGTITTTAALLDTYPGASLALDANGTIFLAEYWPHNRVSRLDGSGGRVTVAGSGEFGFSGDGGPAIQAKLFYPYDLAFGPTGDLFVADGLNKRIRKVTSPSAPAPSATEQEERFVRRAYADLLARAPSPGEVAGATVILAATGSRTQLAMAIVNSYEWRKLLARAIWISLVAREPSAWEIDVATTLLVGGSPVEQVTAFVAGSSEARARAGGTPEGYVDTLFRGAWGVQPDSVGKAAWVAALNAGLPPWHAAFAFLTDHNADRRLVEFAYTAYLRFPADEAGITFWTAQLDKGLRAEHLLAAFIGSEIHWDAS